MPIAAGIALAGLLFTAMVTIIGGVWRFGVLTATQTSMVDQLKTAIEALTKADDRHAASDNEIRRELSDHGVRLTRLETTALVRERMASHPDIASQR